MCKLSSITVACFIRFLPALGRITTSPCGTDRQCGSGEMHVHISFLLLKLLLT
ncbi:hypothetical protein PF005_g3710 [Phytophthora fragariae]|uniref:RxLR effector protein n=1 Tax=Phytophthora fragariae TaxID=53985 RepID=A0A6A3FMD0_9STRA|nr:hypothetical protein PF003_g21337 [Phytophthora fragariae]KAE8946382.1 hypothetical protein PF009_g3988 [Phytophthora fragariae]KAE9024318.1 hypothetical protein PF011_g3562 [Phytophthora fragariae]KAE9130547.1 hypothetical protein PF010_g3810 [Phytophthora fragariae]KAE9134353.1 hypothetical protein PF007_g2973 [Phytophthora fragariae]